MDVPRNYLYTRDHLWIKPEGNRSRVGVTDYSQEELGDVVFIDLPDPGDTPGSRSTPSARSGSAASSGMAKT